jgi:hypothetical protein
MEGPSSTPDTTKCKTEGFLFCYLWWHPLPRSTCETEGFLLYQTDTAPPPSLWATARGGEMGVLTTRNDDGAWQAATPTPITTTTMWHCCHVTNHCQPQRQCGTTATSPTPTANLNDDYDSTPPSLAPNTSRGGVLDLFLCDYSYLPPSLAPNTSRGKVFVILLLV